MGRPTADWPTGRPVLTTTPEIYSDWGINIISVQIEDEYWARRAAEAHDRLAAGEDEVIPFSELVTETEGRS